MIGETCMKMEQLSNMQLCIWRNTIPPPNSHKITFTNERQKENLWRFTSLLSENWNDHKWMRGWGEMPMLIAITTWIGKPIKYVHFISLHKANIKSHNIDFLYYFFRKTNLNLLLTLSDCSLFLKSYIKNFIFPFFYII